MISWFRGIPKRLALARLFYQLDDEKDDWASKLSGLSLRDLGYKAPEKISQILDGESEVQAKSIDDIVDWLLGCQYEDLAGERNKPSVCQHPVEFEKTRVGICVDFALWTWRKLVELGYATEFVVGERKREGIPRQHAWITYVDEHNTYLVEPAYRDRQRMLVLLEDQRSNYVPWASIDQNLQLRVYAGYCSALKRHSSWRF